MIAYKENREVGKRKVFLFPRSYIGIEAITPECCLLDYSLSGSHKGQVDEMT